MLVVIVIVSMHIGAHAPAPYVTDVLQAVRLYMQQPFPYAGRRA